ncbi:hypothetical protein HID58_015803 [Brassica napus]|uniref:Uncharacterized protein n=1 Tax=Brassica napus TaxID=3708 RepID=A0ABQ8DL43_BRANA|nr:hypothetical protein HID58_015803 [Brassica napus]
MKVCLRLCREAAMIVQASSSGLSPCLKIVSFQVFVNGGMKLAVVLCSDGFFIFLYIVVPIFYWSNTYDAQMFPFYTSQTLDHAGHTEKDFDINLDAYKGYSKLYVYMGNVEEELSSSTSDPDQRFLLTFNASAS